MADEPKSMSEVVVLMRQSLPAGVSPSEFGDRIGWGRGSDDALERMKTITATELAQIGLTAETATHGAIAYEAVLQMMPNNPSARGRTALMRHAATLLAGK